MNSKDICIRRYADLVIVTVGYIMNNRDIEVGNIFFHCEDNYLMIMGLQSTHQVGKDTGDIFSNKN